MLDQYFGHKELYSVVLRANTPMQFGTRHIEVQEPVLYFNSVQMSLLSEQNRPIFARGGWANMPHVIWDERSEVQFQMVDGVMSSAGFGILLGANVATQEDGEPLYINMREELEPLGITHEKTVKNEKRYFPVIELKHKPVMYPTRKIFIFTYDHNTIQQKIYGLCLEPEDALGSTHYRMALALDKNFETPAENNGSYVIDYYYKYEEEDTPLIYSVNKERFNGLFSLEAKFYSKDENEGHNYTNILYMPKVRIVSNINLQLGERANPTVSTFNIIGMPETVGETRNLIMEITRLSEAVDGDI